ncbi:MAG: hypothetical protein GY853_08140 [PVC group bacterium]|nr:hypothetical protein [PVC group bacterium]
MDTIYEKVKKSVEDLLIGTDIGFVDLQIISLHNKSEIKVFVDKRGDTGITLDVCAKINRQLGDIIEEEGIFLQKYIIEVSSPGLDRPLKKESDFIWALGRRVKIVTRVPVVGKDKTLVGTIKVVKNGCIDFLTEDDVKINIAIEDIIKAKLEVRW